MLVWNVDINAEIVVSEISVITLMEAVHMDVRLNDLVINMKKSKILRNFLTVGILLLLFHQIPETSFFHAPIAVSITNIIFYSNNLG